MCNLVFDLDGTLIDSSAEILACLQKAFALANCAIDESRLVPALIGLPVKVIVDAILPAQIHNREQITTEVACNFRDIYDNDTNDISSFFVGADVLLKKLLEQGHRLFIATIKPAAATSRLLTKFNWDFFSDIYTIDKDAQQLSKTDMLCDIIGKYNLEKSQTMMVGDTLVDMEAARNADVTGVAVSWGYCKDLAALSQNAAFTVGSMAELEKIIVDFMVAARGEKR